MQRFVIIILLLVFSKLLFSQTQEVPFTLADRDRLIQLEADVKSLRYEINVNLKSIDLRFEGVYQRFDGVDQKFDIVDQRFEGVYQRFDGVDQRFEGIYQRFDSIDQRFENLENQISDIKIFLYWGFGILFSFMLFMMGFILWDRRSMVKPVKEDVELLKLENEKMKDIFRKQAVDQPQLWEILKNAGIL